MLDLVWAMKTIELFFLFCQICALAFYSKFLTIFLTLILISVTINPSLANTFACKETGFNTAGGGYIRRAISAIDSNRTPHQVVHRYLCKIPRDSKKFRGRKLYVMLATPGGVAKLSNPKDRKRRVVTEEEQGSWNLVLLELENKFHSTDTGNLRDSFFYKPLMYKQITGAPIGGTPMYMVVSSADIIAIDTPLSENLKKAVLNEMIARGERAIRFVKSEMQRPRVLKAIEKRRRTTKKVRERRNRSEHESR